MATDSAVPVTPGSGDNIDAVTLTTGFGSVFRQRVSIGDVNGIGGPFLAMVTPSTNGTALTSGPTGVEVTIPSGGSYTYTVASSAPTAAPTLLRTITNSGSSSIIDQINLASGNLVYVTATTAGTTQALSYRTI